MMHDYQFVSPKRLCEMTGFTRVQVYRFLSAKDSRGTPYGAVKKQGRWFIHPELFVLWAKEHKEKPNKKTRKIKQVIRVSKKRFEQVANECNNKIKNDNDTLGDLTDDSRVCDMVKQERERGFFKRILSAIRPRIGLP